MKRRRVIGGQTYIQTRSGGWRLVMNGYIRTRRGWRKLQQRTRRRRARAPTIPVAETITPTILTVPPQRCQWSGKYDALRSAGGVNVAMKAGGAGR